MADQEDDALPLNTRELVKKVASAIPAAEMYKDLAQPAAKELGRGLETTAKAISGLLMPLRGLVWGMDKIEREFIPRLASKLAKTKDEELVPPKIGIAGPVLESLRYLGEDPVLREIFANLLATSMTKEGQHLVHPAYIEFAKQITPDEARILYYVGLHLNETDSYPLLDVRSKESQRSGYRMVASCFSNISELARCEKYRAVQSYIVNLSRLGLIIIPDDGYLTNDKLYDPLIRHPFVIRMVDEIKDLGLEADLDKKYFRITALGKDFYRACIADNSGIE